MASKVTVNSLSLQVFSLVKIANLPLLLMSSLSHHQNANSKITNKCKFKCPKTFIILCRCEVCNKGCTDKNTLKIHMKSHDKSRPSYTCQKCGKNYVSQNGLNDHIKTHENNREWRCHTCGKGFNTKQVLYGTQNYYLLKI